MLFENEASVFVYGRLSRQLFFIRRNDMDYEMRQLSVEDGTEIYEMLQELPKDENGFINGVNGKTFEEYKKWLIKSDNTAKGVGLESWMVPQNVYRLFVDGIPVGIGKLRHYLNDKLREEGGHVGYAVRPSYRNKGYGKLLLKLLIREAESIGIDRVLLTVRNQNIYSVKVALSNGGVIESVNDARHFIWIEGVLKNTQAHKKRT